MSQSTERISGNLTRGERRRAAIMKAATEVFLEHGYRSARLEEVIRRSGGSLATIYALFGSKQGLFAAIIADICEEIVASLPNIDEPGSEPPHQTLLAFASTYLGLLLEPQSLALYRVAVSEGVRSPELAQAVFAAGPSKAAERLARYLCWQTANGTLVCSNPALAARQFLEMVKGDLHFRALLGAGSAPTVEEINACAGAATRTFLNGISCREPSQAHPLP
jgi:AcrR family transcriptional regulator